MEAGYLDSITDIVFVSLGGNDALFSNVLDFCIKSAANCPEDTMPGDTTDLDTAERRRIVVEVPLKMWDAMDRIRTSAPNAHIVVASYPRLFDGTSIECLDGLGPTELSWMNDMADLLAEKTRVMLDGFAQEHGTPITFVDTRQAFEGRGPCTGDPRGAINGFVLNKTPGDDPGKPVSAESFHPNVDGTHLYADAINTAMGWG